MAADLKPAEKNQVVARLAEAGLSRGSQGGLSPEVTEKLRKELGLAAGQQPLPERVAEMAAILVEVVSKVDQAATGALKQLSPRNPLLKAEALRRVLAQYVQTEQPAAPPSTRAFEMLSGALLTALLEGGLEFGRRYLERMQPSAIWDVATPDIFIDFRKKAAAWDHFRELSTDFYSSPEKINQSVKQALGATIDAAVSR